MKYIAFKERVRLLQHVKWYIKLDLKDGYRQLPVHPSEWKTQVYPVGPTEYYIDLAMPFGKANSSKIFCRWASLWFTSCVSRFNTKYKARAVLGSYVDDGFGGDKDYSTAQALIRFVTDAGNRHGTLVNAAKTRGPAIAMVILGLQYHSMRKICSLDPAKVTKYSTHISELLMQNWVTSKDLERMVGRLEFAAWVEPYGRPLLTFLSSYIKLAYPQSTRPLTNMMMICLRVWHLLLTRNRGLHFSFILGKLPRMAHPFLVDASLSGGIGGYCGLRYFSMSIAQLKP